MTGADELAPTRHTESMSNAWFHTTTIQTGQQTLEPAEAQHAVNSLRLRNNHPITLFDGRGHTASGPIHIEEASSRRRKIPQVTVSITQIQFHRPPTPRVRLITAAPKGNRLNWLVEKATELATATIHLAQFDRSIVKTNPNTIEKLRRNAVEACKQSQNPWLPDITTAQSLSDALARCEGEPLLAAHRTPDATPLPDWVASWGTPPAAVTIIIGPEGGLTDTERNQLVATGAETVTLGPNILRIETAAITAAAILTAGALPLPPN